MLRLGRLQTASCPVPWDRAISRAHADIWWDGGRLTVKCLESARNPISYDGRSVREVHVSVGDTFRIGGTTFEVARADDNTVVTGPFASPLATFETVLGAENVVAEHAYSADDLRRVGFRNASKQLDILSGLPQLISASQSEEDLAQRIVGLLLEAMPQADAAAVAQYDVATLPENVSGLEAFPQPGMIRVDIRDGFAGRFRPSRRLIAKALTQQETVLQFWGEDEQTGGFTISEGLGWAFVVPLPGESCHGWCLYVAGKGGRGGALVVTEDDLKGDLRFTELVAQFISSIRQVRLLHEQKTQLSAFFSPKVIENIIDTSSQSLLTPAEQDITVLFCDVRGFSGKSEQLRDDLHRLLESVRAALGVMANSILDFEGAIADFQGDAALGFWGWPVPLEDGPMAACRAALAIATEFSKTDNRGAGLLEGLKIGIGVAHGRALAGQIGTAKQAKVGVFGPVVNRGSRLDGMTKQFGVPICVDKTTAEFVRRLLPPSEGRLRRLAVVLPQGMYEPLLVHGLIPPKSRALDLTQQQLADHEAAVDAVIEGRWPTAIELLDPLPPDDGPARFLRSYLSEHQEPPPDWHGVIPLKTK
jgi:adenylate cyclase